MTNVDEGVVEIEGGAISWEAAGDGAAVTFAPGCGTGGRGTRSSRRSPRRTASCDTTPAAMVRSTRPEPGRPYSHVRDLMAVLDAAEVERTALIGCSMGGGIEIDFALEHPERVSALALVAPGLGGFEGTPEEEQAWEAWDADRGRGIESAIEAGDLERAQDLRLRIWAPLGTNDEAGRRIREIAFDNLHELTMDESGQERLDPPAFARLGEIRAPTLILPADHDPPWHDRICGVLVERIANARLVQIRETDHVVNMRQPDEFNRVVLGFLGEVL